MDSTFAILNSNLGEADFMLRANSSTIIDELSVPAVSFGPVTIFYIICIKWVPNIIIYDAHLLLLRNLRIGKRREWTILFVNSGCAIELMI